MTAALAVLAWAVVSAACIALALMMVLFAVATVRIIRGKGDK